MTRCVVECPAPVCRALLLRCVAHQDATELLGKLIFSPHADYVSEYRNVLMDWLGRDHTLSPEIRTLMVSLGVELIERKPTCQIMAAATPDAMAGRPSCPSLDFVPGATDACAPPPPPTTDSSPPPPVEWAEHPSAGPQPPRPEASDGAAASSAPRPALVPPPAASAVVKKDAEKAAAAARDQVAPSSPVALQVARAGVAPAPPPCPLRRSLPSDEPTRPAPSAAAIMAAMAKLREVI